MLRGFKIVHQNIQSLASKIEQLRLLICELNSGLHILTLSETWLKSDVSDGEYEILGFDCSERTELEGMAGLRHMFVMI